MSPNEIGPEATLAQVERALGLARVVVAQLGWDGEEYSCRLRCRNSGKISFGLGKTIAAALADAFDEMTVEVRTRAGAR